MSNKRIEIIDVGFGNIVMRERIVAIVNSEAKPIKRCIDNAKKTGRLIDATSGRKTRTMIITDSNHAILSSLQPQTLAQRVKLR